MHATFTQIKFGRDLLLWWVWTPQTIQKHCGEDAVLKIYSVIDSLPPTIVIWSEGIHTIAKPFARLQIEQLHLIISFKPLDRKTSSCISPQWHDALTVLFSLIISNIPPKVLFLWSNHYQINFFINRQKPRIGSIKSRR